MIDYRSLSQDIYETSLQLRLLDELDADSVEAAIVSQLSQKSSKSKVIMQILCVPAVAYLWKKLPSGILLGAIVGGASLGFILKKIISRQISSVPNNLHKTLNSTAALHSFIKQKEMAAFGIGLRPGLALLKQRLRIFRTLRSFALYLRESIDRLTFNFLSEEEHKTLLRQYDTVEMSELLSQEVDENSVHIGDGGLNALRDLCTLHASEFIRLLIIFLVNPESHNTSNLFKFCSTLNRRLTIQIQEMDGIASSSLSQYRDRINTTEKKVYTQSKISLVADSLEHIRSGLENGSMSLEETKQALQRLLTTDVFCSNEKNTEPLDEVEQKTVAQEDIQIATVEKRSAEPIDQVFETVACCNDAEQTSIEDWCDIPHSKDHSLMNELIVALGDRSREFEERERRALAEFYGVTEEELQLKIEREKMQEKKLELETVAEGNEEAIVREIPHIAPLPSDLLAALAMRQKGKVCSFGDESDSE